MVPPRRGLGAANSTAPAFIGGRGMVSWLVPGGGESAGVALWRARTVPATAEKGGAMATERHDMDVAARDDKGLDEDIQGELFTSSREAAMSFVPFGDVDLAALASAVETRRPRDLRPVR